MQLDSVKFWYTKVFAADSMLVMKKKSSIGPIVPSMYEKNVSGPKDTSMS